jgi:hypothetical protein
MESSKKPNGVSIGLLRYKARSADSLFDNSHSLTFAQVVDIQTKSLGDFRQDLSKLTEQTKIRIEGSTQQLKDAQNTIETLALSQQQNIQAAAELQQKMQSAKTQNTAINVGVSLNQRFGRM